MVPGLAPARRSDAWSRETGVSRAARRDSRQYRRKSSANSLENNGLLRPSLGCSDSRVPPELLFDAGFGELFVIRIAGNAMSAEVAGSLQYAGVHLKTPLFLVLGHEGCGAVSAAVDTHFQKVRYRSRISKLVSKIVPAIRALNPKLPPDQLLSQGIEANVRWTMKQIRSSPEGKARVAEGRVKLVGAIYAIETGRVRFLP